MKKLKTVYKNYFRHVRIGNEFRPYYPNIRSGTHKRFSTKQEKSYYFLHEIEYENISFRIRAKRGNALADPWSDYPSDVYELRKSWKHNSKRRKQY